MAIGKNNDAKGACPNDGGCANKDAVDSSQSAKTLGLVSTIGFAAGGAALVAGAVLVFTAPSAPKKDAAAVRVRLVPRASVEGGGVDVLATF
jgi:hypothetical protein